MIDGRRSRLDEANARWREMLAHWAIPEEIQHAAPASPHFFDPAVFAKAADDALERSADSPSDEVARASLPRCGAILDVGCGAGAASLRLRPHRLTGIDPNQALLDELVRRARRLEIETSTVQGLWPDDADHCPVADVIVCHHVLYNVADLAAFATALDAHARERIVVEATTVHPLSWTAPYWRELHGLVRPDRPTVDDALAVLETSNRRVHIERWVRRYPPVDAADPMAVARLARRLCLPDARHDELRTLLNRFPVPTEREVATLWW